MTRSSWQRWWWASLLIAQAASAGATNVRAPRQFDLGVAAYTAMPERLSLCLAAHPHRLLEVDGCVSPDGQRLTATTHALLRHPWQFRCDGPRCVELGLGAGLGPRVTRFCRGAVCGLGAGVELLASLEVVQWLVDGFGLSLQLDAGVAVVWAEAAKGVVRASYLVPVRLLAGVSF